MIVSTSEDHHADAVVELLRRRGIFTTRLDLSVCANSRIDVAPGEYVEVGDTRVTDGWVIWWRRARAPEPELWPEVGPGEALLLVAELRDIVLGGLLSLRLSWVDEPYTVLRAEQKMLQLATACRLGIPVPQTAATNDVGRGEQFVSSGPAIAKAISSGPGLAPYADVVTMDLVPRIAVAPTVLQARVPCIADVRAVVIGGQTLCWLRPRSRGSSVDWRQDDRHGIGFAPSRRDLLGNMAVAINGSLGLSISVQDWLIDTTGQPVFLEANPCGSWMFLEGAADSVAPVLAAHLAGGVGSDG